MEINDVCMTKKEKHNIERRKWENVSEKKLTTRMPRYQNNRMVCTLKQKMSSLNVCQKLNRQYLYVLDKKIYETTDKLYFKQERKQKQSKK